MGAAFERRGGSGADTFAGRGGGGRSGGGGGNREPVYPRILILAPTRELACQIFDDSRKVGLFAAQLVKRGPRGRRRRKKKEEEEEEEERGVGALSSSGSPFLLF